MKVYVCLTEVDYEGFFQPEHIFKNKEDAERWLLNNPGKPNWFETSIEEYEVE